MFPMLISAQMEINDIAYKNKYAIKSIKKIRNNSYNIQKGITLWENDFSDTSDWTYSNSSAPALDWLITSMADTIPVTSLSPALFTTVSNGFAFIDSDAQGTTATQDANMTYTGLIDLTGYNNVSLVFEQSYRTYLDTRIIRVSNDAGLTWTDFVVTDGTEPTAQNTLNPDIYSVDISSVAGGNDSVVVQLNYQGNWGWYWAVDDMKIVETDDFDIKLQGVSWGTDGAYGTRLPYSYIPIAQIAPIHFAGITKNIGVNDITDAVFTANIVGGVFSGSSATSIIVSGQTDTLQASNTFTPSLITTNHLVDFNVSTNAGELDTSNNYVASLELHVNENIYARDMDTVLGTISNSGEGFEVGNVFDIFEQQDIGAIDAYIAPTSEPGAEVFTILYSIDPSTGDFNYMTESNPIYLTQANIGQKLTFELQVPQQLQANNSYLAVVMSYGDGGTTNDLVVSTSGSSEAQTTFYFDHTDQTWYYTTSTPMVRLNFDPAYWSGVNELNEFNVSIYPNPATDVLNVNNTIIGDELIVYDYLGKVISKSVANSTQQSILIKDFNQGVYLISVIRNGHLINKRFVVK